MCIFVIRMMKRFLFLFLSLSLFLLGSTMYAQTRAQDLVDKLSREEPLQSASWGVLAVRANGDTLACYQHRVRRVPASNVKLITTGAALQKLGGEFRFETALAYSGTVADSTLRGDLYIIGGGDPTLGSDDGIPSDSLFRQWTGMLEAAGIREIDGYVIGDGRLFPGDLERVSWNYDDIGTYYAPGGNGLSWHENTLDVRIEAGDSVGAPIRITPVTPAETPWLRTRNFAVTGPRQSKNTVLLFTTDLSPEAEWRGSFPIDRKPHLTSVANKYGSLSLAYAFCAYLEQAGIGVIDGPADIDRDGRIRDFRTAAEESFGPRWIAQPADSLTRIGVSQSPKLRDIARWTQSRSDNFYAEALLRAIGLKVKGSGAYEDALAAEKTVLSNLGAAPGTGAKLDDGSGLSRLNYVSPDYYVRFLRAIWKSSARVDFLESLPRAGATGSTLESMFPKKDRALKNRFRMKSGSMNGVLCYSGYILPSSGSTASGADIITFSILTNNASVNAAKMRPILEEILLALAQENE